MSQSAAEIPDQIGFLDAISELSLAHPMDLACIERRLGEVAVEQKQSATIRKSVATKAAEEGLDQPAIPRRRTGLLEQLKPEYVVAQRIKPKEIL